MGHGGRDLDVNLKDQDGNQVLAYYQNLRANEISRLIYPKAKIRVSSTEVMGLPNIPCIAVHLKAKSTNAGAIWVGGINELAARASYGIPLEAGEDATIKPENANLVTLLGENNTDEIYVLIEMASGNTPTYIDSLPPVTDSTPPEVSSVSPVDETTDVARDTNIFGIFDEDIDPLSVTATSFTISPSVTANRYVDSENTAKVVMDPESNLAASTAYTITLKGGVGADKIKDLAGNNLAADYVWNFTTAADPPPPDTTPPTVSSTDPTSGATNVLTTISPMVVFDESMLGSSINTTNIKVKKVSDGTVVSTGVSLGGDQKTVTITVSLAFSTEYQIVVTVGVEDLAGNNLATEFTSNFTTKAPSYTLIYNVSDTGETLDLGTSSMDRWCLKVKNTSSPMYNKVCRKLIVKLRRGSGTSGTVYVKIYNATWGEVATIGSKPLSSITSSSSGANYTFENPTLTDAHKLQVNYKVGVEYAGSDTFRVFRDDTASYDGSNTIGTRHGTTEEEEPSYDFAGSIYE